MEADAAAPAEKQSDRTRLFFALWPPGAIAGVLHRKATAMRSVAGGRAMRRETLHLTLSFLGDMPRERIPELLSVGSAVRFTPFRLRLDTLGHWAREKLVWAGPGQHSPELDDLAADLCRALAASGFELEDRPFRPHVTLLRNVANAWDVQEPAEFEVVDWEVEEFVLVESLRLPEGAQYAAIGHWPD